MKQIRSGFAFHGHHEVLLEYAHNYDLRVSYLEQGTPKGGRALRLRLFQLIPENLLPGLDSPEFIAFKKAGVAYAKAWDAYRKVNLEQADTFEKAATACVKARVAYYEAFKEEIEQLHTRLCPDCPWDGKTIFPRGGING